MIFRGISRQERCGDRGVAGRHHVYADAPAVDITGDDPQRVRAVGRRRFATVGRLLFERDDAHALIVGPYRFNDLLVTASVMWTHEQRYPKLAAEVHRRAYSEPGEIVVVTHDENLIPAQHRRRALSQRVDPHFAATGQEHYRYHDRRSEGHGPGLRRSGQRSLSAQVGGTYSKKRLTMKSVLRLALATDAVAFATIVLGSWTRINGAGLACPDWPLCQGRLLPPLTNGTAFEWLHRLFAFAVTPLVVALLAAAWRKRNRSPFIPPAVALIAALFAVQISLGAATVRLANAPLSVVSHWGTAMAFLAAVSALAIFAAACDRIEAAPSDASRAAIATIGILALTTVAAFVTMCLGAYVSSSGAGLACLSVPGCAGNVVVYSAGQDVQMLHRIAAASTLILSAASLAVSWACAASARVRTFTSAAMALVCIQVLLGLLNVVLRLPADLREAHAINAALVFLAYVVATSFAVLEMGALRPEATARP